MEGIMDNSRMQHQLQNSVANVISIKNRWITLFSHPVAHYIISTEVASNLLISFVFLMILMSVRLVQSTRLLAI